MYFKIVSKHNNMSHDGDLLRSALYFTNANESVVEKIISITKENDASLSSTEKMVCNSLVALGYEANAVTCDKVFSISE